MDDYFWYTAKYVIPTNAKITAKSSIFDPNSRDTFFFPSPSQHRHIRKVGITKRNLLFMNLRYNTTTG